jgi:hypothetical protein
MVTGRSRTRLGVSAAALTLLGTAGLLLPPASVAGTRVTAVKVAATGGQQIPCEGGANGFVDISDDAQGSIVTGALTPDTNLSPPDGVSLDLESGFIENRWSGWAHLHGATHTGDLVWMDWTTDNGRSWGQCGPFRIDFDGQSKTSASKPTSFDPNYRFRAGGVVSGVLYISDWW